MRFFIFTASLAECVRVQKGATCTNHAQQDARRQHHSIAACPFVPSAGAPSECKSDKPAGKLTPCVRPQPRRTPFGSNRFYFKTPSKVNLTLFFFFFSFLMPAIMFASFLIFIQPFGGSLLCSKKKGGGASVHCERGLLYISIHQSSRLLSVQCQQGPVKSKPYDSSPDELSLVFV